MISIRNLGYDRLLVSYYVGPLTGVTRSDVEAALRDVLLSPRGAPLRWRNGRGGWRGITADAAAAVSARAVTEQAVASSRLEFAKTVLSRGFEPGDLPVRVILADGMLGFTMAHALFDGTGATAMIALLVEKLGTPGVDDVAPRPVAAAPMRPALQKFSLWGLQGVRTARQVFRTVTAQTETGYQLERTLAKADSLDRTALVSMVLEPEALRRIAATPELARNGNRPARPPVSIKTAALVLRTLRDCAAADVDFRVVVPIDCRRWAEKGSDVDGNFSPSVPMGRLVADPWTATDLLDRISAAMKSGLPVTWLLANGLVGLKSAVRHPLASRRPPASTPRVPFEIHLSLPSTEASVPERLLPAITPDTLIGGIPGHLDFPLGVWVEVAPMRDTLHITVWDETGTFELDGFEERLRSAISASETSAAS